MIYTYIHENHFRDYKKLTLPRYTVHIYIIWSPDVQNSMWDRQNKANLASQLDFTRVFNHDQIPQFCLFLLFVAIFLPLGYQMDRRGIDHSFCLINDLCPFKEHAVPLHAVLEIFLLLPIHDALIRPLYSIFSLPLFSINQVFHHLLI